MFEDYNEQEDLNSQNYLSNDDEGLYVLERQIQYALNKEYKGSLEYSVPVGRIDILNNNYLVEIKLAEKWKEGIGQLFSYSTYIEEDIKKVLVLFGYLDNKLLIQIKNVCKKLNIELRLISSQIKIFDVDTLENERKYTKNTLIRNQNIDKKTKRINLIIENLEKDNKEILDLLCKLEPDSKRDTLYRFLKTYKEKTVD